jgi:16S rRNA (guanine527-N7)-methyltransferase
VADPVSGGSDAGLDALGARYDLDLHALRGLRALLGRLSSDPRAPTAVQEPELVLERHLADSLVGLELDPLRAAGSVADLGSGAGLPGLVLAAALPAVEFHLVESQQSRCAYIGASAAAMGLHNVRVVCARAEEWPDGRGAHDLVVTRALAPQAVVLEYAAPLLAAGGHLVEWRGRRDADQETWALRAAAELGLEREEIRSVSPFAAAQDRHLHVFRKVADTPERFPRRPGVAARRPLGS